MSFSFFVRPVGSLGSWQALLAGAQLGQPVALHGAVEVDRPWPRAGLQRVPDASRRPVGLSLTAAQADVYQRVGHSGAFLAFHPKTSTRGVEVSQQRGLVVVRVPALASVDDYLLATRLAGAIASAQGVGLAADHGPAGEPVGPMRAEEALARYDAAFAQRHLENTGGQLLSALSPGATLDFYGPRGWVRLDGATLPAGQPREHLEAALAQLRAPPPITPGPAPDEAQRQLAVLLTRCMLFVVSGRGESWAAGQVQAQLLTVPELRGFEPGPVLEEAMATHRDVSGLRALSADLREKAFVLAAEVAAAADVEGFTGSGALGALASALQVDAGLAEAVTRTCAAKFAPAPDSTLASAQTQVAVLLLMAVADGRIEPVEQAATLVLGQTSPSLRTHALPTLVRAAEAQVSADLGGMAKACGQLSAVERTRAYVLGCELAHLTGGLTRSSAGALGRVGEWCGPDAALAEASAHTFRAKYG